MIRRGQLYALVFILLLAGESLIPGAMAANVAQPPRIDHSKAYFPGRDLSTLTATGSLILLPIRCFQQTTDYTCGPAVLLTLLKYYGKPADELEIAKEVRTRPGSGTHPLAMVSYLRKHGFDVEWGEETAGDGSGMKMIRRNLEQGIPTIVEWIDWGGHYGLAIGHDTRGTETVDDDVIILADPYDKHDDLEEGITVFNAERFYYMWFDSKCFDRPMTRVWIKAIPVHWDPDHP